MPIQVSLYQQVLGFAVAGEDIQFGEADTQEVVATQGGQQVKVKYARKTAKVVLRGLNYAQVQSLIATAKNNRRSLILSPQRGVDLAIGGQILSQAVLVEANPAPAIAIVAGQYLQDIELTFESLVYS